jgi:hypothetical protein
MNLAMMVEQDEQAKEPFFDGINLSQNSLTFEKVLQGIYLYN